MSVEALPSDASRDEQPLDDFRARLVIPAATRYLRLARLTAAGLAGDLGFRVDSVEDLRVAVDELCAVIIDGTPAGTMLELTYREHDDGLVIDMTDTRSTGLRPPEPASPLVRDSSYYLG